MKRLYYLLLILPLMFLQNCEEADLDTDLNYVTFAEDSYTTGVDVDGSSTVNVTVFSSNINGGDRSFNVIVDPASVGDASSFQVPATVTIPGGTNVGILPVVLFDNNLGIGVNKLILRFEPIANQDFGPTVTVNYSQNCEEISAVLDIVFDGYGSEIGYTVLDGLGGEVISVPAGTFADGDPSASVSFNLCLGRDYTFTLTDSFGDGLSFPANGSYTLTVNGIEKASGGGNFGSADSTEFTAN